MTGMDMRGAFDGAFRAIAIIFVLACVFCCAGGAFLFWGYERLPYTVSIQRTP